MLHTPSKRTEKWSIPWRLGSVASASASEMHTFVWNKFPAWLGAEFLYGLARRRWNRDR